MGGSWRTWSAAMADALYGTDGFYPRVGAPGRHFRTAAHASSLWAQAMYDLAALVDTSLGQPADFTVVDVGAGGGELLRGLADLAPPHWSLVGVDVADRPPDLPSRVTWLPTPPSTVTGLLLAVELLDVVPLDVVELTGQGPRLVEVTTSGEERAVRPLDSEVSEWQQRWWPLAEAGDRAEVGRSRDVAWHGLTARLTRGLAVAIDYVAVPDRDIGGSLTGYRDGRQVAPVPDGSRDLTAHVLLESLTVPGDVVLTQRDALRQLGMSAVRPSYEGDPVAYLAALSRTGEAAELLDPQGLGGFGWVLHPVGIDHPLPTAETTSKRSRG